MHQPTLSFLALAALLWAALPLSAQDDTTRLSTFDAAPVVVAASRAGADAPVAQTTIDSAALRQVVVGQDLQYVLELTAPSIIAYSESGTNFSNYGSFRMRGIDQTRINVTLNGAPLNDMIDQGVFFSNMTDLANGMSSIQVQRGVGISQNGTASYAGSVNLESPALGNTTPSGRLQFNTGSFGLLRGSAEVMSGMTDADVALYAKVTTFTSDGYRYNTNTSSQSGQVSAAWFGTSDVLRLNAFAGRTDNRIGYIPVPKPLADEDPRTNVNDSTDYDDFGQWLLQLDWSHRLSSMATLGVMTYYGGAGGDYFSGFRDDEGTLTQINYPLTNRHLGAMVNLSLERFGPGIKLDAGLHAYRFWRRNWEAVSPELESPYYDDRTEKDEVSGFVRADWRVGGFGLYADLQLRAVQMTFRPDLNWIPAGTTVPVHDWFFVNPRLGITYNLDDASMLYASAGRTGREPTRFDLLGGTQINEANLDVVLNPGTVKAEYATDLEIGFRSGSQTWSVDVNGFAMFFDDEIAPIGQYIDQWFVQLRKNVPSSRRLGVELQASVQPMAGLTLSLNGTWMTSNIDEYAPDDGSGTVYTDVQAVLTPNVMGSFTAAYAPLEPLSIRATVRHVGQQWLELTNDPSLVLEAFTLLDLGVSWNFYGQHRVGVALNNVLDERYATNGAATFYEGATVPAVFIQAPRNIMLLLEVNL